MTQVDLTTKSPQELYALAVAYRRLAIQHAESMPKLRGEKHRVAFMLMCYCNDMANECNALIHSAPD